MDNASKAIMAFSVVIALGLMMGYEKEATASKGSRYELTKLNAVKVSRAPVVDGNGSDAVWANAPELVASLGEGMETSNCSTCHALNSSVKVTLKAVHTNSKLYILASWPDSTASFTRSGSWSFANGTWQKSSGQSEDRIGFFFPIGTIGGDDYNTGGCMTKCHTMDKHPGTPGLEDECYLTGGKADMWHMKAARSLPATSASGSGLTVDPRTHEVIGGTVSMVGWMDDKYVANWSAGNAPDGGRYGDAGSSTYSHNRIADKSRPKYMEKNPTDFMDAMVLSQSEIDAGEVVGDSTNGVSNSDAAIYWPNYAALKAVVPERILKPATGSRANIKQAAIWRNGTWTTEIARDLNTGHDGDVQFTVGQEYIFGVAIMDNTGGEGHKTSGKQVLKILP